jgi:hypothetical protein
MSLKMKTMAKSTQVLASNFRMAEPLRYLKQEVK